MNSLRFLVLGMMLSLTLLHVSAVYALPGDIHAQFSINNLTGDGRSPTTPQGIAYHGGFLWVSDFATDRIYRVYPETVYDTDDVTVLFNPGDSDLNIPLYDANDPPINSDGSAITSCFTNASGVNQYCGGGGLTFARNYLWNASPVTDDIIKIDSVDGDNLETENTLAGLQFPSPTDITYDGRHFWIVDWQSNTINEVLPEDGTVLSTIPGPSSLPAFDQNASPIIARPFGVTWDGTALWVSDHHEDKIYRVDSNTGALLNIFDSPGGTPRGLAWDGDSLWHVDQSSRTIYKIDAGVIPIGLLGCIEKNGRALSGDALLSQQSIQDQSVTIDGDGCFIFQSFTSGVPLSVTLNERGVDEKPVIVLNEVSPGVKDVTLLVGDSYVEPGFVATDNEDGDISFDVVATPDVVNAPQLINTASPRTVTVAYDVVDSAGNLADTVYRTISVLVPDTTPPQISLQGSNPLYIEQGSAYIEAGATAQDDRDGDISARITITGSVNVNATGTYNLRYNVSDNAGNAASTITRSVIVQDTSAPIISLLGANPLSHEKGQAFIDPGATATDGNDGDLTSAIIRSGSIPASVGSYILTYNVSDSSGNAAATVSRTVNVIDNGTPVITLIGANPFNIERDTVFVDPGVMAIDSPSENISASVVVTGTVNTSVVGAYTLTYNVTDSSGNAAVPVSRVVNVVDSGPVLTLLGANPLNHSINTPFVDPGATAFDSADGDLTPSITSSSNVNTAVAGSYSISYSVRDSQNNAAIPVTRVVNVNDFSAPVISLIGNSTMQVDLGSAFIDPGASASDNGDGDLSASIVRTGSVNTSVVGSYVLNYNVTDSTGNRALQVSRTVNVTDGQAPTLSLNGVSPMQHEAGTAFNDPGASANDGANGNISNRIVVSGTVNPSVPGNYTLTYNVTDVSGNAAPSVSRTVIVSDTTAPSLTLNGSATVNHNLGAAFSDPGATAFDSVGGSITSRIVVSGTVNVNVAGTYTLTYNVSDISGNAAPTRTRQVNVGDFLAPVITRIGAATVSIMQGSNYQDAGATAVDNIDGNLTAFITVTNPVNTAIAGTYTVRYNVSDLSNNRAVEVSRLVQVAADAVAPEISLLGEADMSVIRGTSFTDPGARASDDRDGNLNSRITRTGSVNINTAGNYILTYSVSDNAGNQASVNRRVRVVVPANINIEAETGRLSGFLGTRNSGSGYTGSGYVRTSGFFVRVGDYIEFTGVNTYAIPYTLNIRYSGTNNGVAEVRLNGNVVGSLNMPSTGSSNSWTRTQKITINPAQGNNTIRLVILDKGANIDSIRLIAE